MWKHLTVYRIGGSPRKLKGLLPEHIKGRHVAINPNLEQVAERAKEIGRYQSVIRRVKGRYRPHT